MPNFNSSQLEVIHHDGGALQVAAVAGAGKTTAVVNLIADLIKTRRVSAKSILATTFSKKAAGEMQDRLNVLIPGTDARIGTLHSICYEIVRDGSPWEQFDVATDGWIRTAVKMILGYQEMDWKNVSADEVLSYISACKAALYSPEEADPRGDVSEKYQIAYQKFEARREMERKITFDDMIVYAYKWLQKDRQVRGCWESKYAWVIVDEFQDTAHAQYEVLKILAKNAHFVAIGDGDQCQPAGTKIMMAGGETKNIEDIRPGMMVATYELNGKTHGILKPELGARVKQFSVREYDGHMVEVSSYGKVSQYTMTHRCIVRLPDFSEMELQAHGLSNTMEVAHVPDGKNTFGLDPRFPQWKSIKDIRFIHFNGLVYSIEVEGHGTYIADGMVTHNSIFAWRSCNPDYFNNFHTEHKAKLIKMEENYRSGRRICKYANELIQVNEKRIKKELRPTKDMDGTIVVKSLVDMDVEAEYIADEVEKHIASGVKLHDIFVLYRTGVQSQPVAMEFMKRGIPHIVWNGGNLFKRKEIKALISYVNAAINPKDIESWHNIINVPFRYLGTAFIREWDMVSKHGTHEQGLKKMLSKAKQSRQRQSVSEVLGIVDHVRSMFQQSMTVGQAFRYIIEETDLEKYLVDEEGEGSCEDDRMAYVWRVVDLGDMFSKPEKFMDKILEMQRPVERDVNGKALNKVQLMSCHGSKGLESKVVFVIGFTRGLMPHRRSDNLEEERCLAYVAMTRAMDTLYLTYPETGLNDRVGGPSQYLYECGLLKESEDAEDCPERAEGHHVFLAGMDDEYKCIWCQATYVEAGVDVKKKTATDVAVVAESGPAPVFVRSRG